MLAKTDLFLRTEKMMRIFHMKEMNLKMVGRIIICFIVQYQRKPLLNDDLELQKMMRMFHMKEMKTKMF